MRKFLGITLVVLSVTVLTVSAFAQPAPGGGDRGRDRGRGFGPGDGITQLIRNDEIKSQLGLTEEQITKLEKAAEELRANRGAGPGGQGGERRQPPSREDIQRFQAEAEKRIEETQTKINQILTTEQQEKLKVLQFQLSGGLDSPFLNARSLAALTLSEEQQNKIKSIVESRNAENFAAMRDVDFRNLSQEEREKLNTEREARNKKFAEQIKAVLTPEQKEKAEKLIADAGDLREKVGLGRGGERGAERRGGENRREGNYRPEDSSFRPGQGAGGERQNRQRRSFPQTENNNQ